MILIRFADRGLVVDGKPDLLLFRQLYWVSNPLLSPNSIQHSHTPHYKEIFSFTQLNLNPPNTVFMKIAIFVIVQALGGVRHLLHPRDHHVPSPPDVQRHIQTVHSGIYLTHYFFTQQLSSRAPRILMYY